MKFIETLGATLGLALGLTVLLAAAAFWAIDVLFGFYIPLTFKNWLAFVVLKMCLTSALSIKAKT